MKKTGLSILNDHRVWMLVFLGVVFTLSINAPSTTPYDVAIFFGLMLAYGLLLIIVDHAAGVTPPTIEATIKQALADAQQAVFSPDDFKQALQLAMQDFVTAQGVATKATEANTAATNLNTQMTAVAPITAPPHTEPSFLGDAKSIADPVPPRAAPVDTTGVG